MSLHPFENALRIASDWPIDVAISVARDRETPLTERQAAVASVLSQLRNDLPNEQRNDLIREFLFDDSIIVQRLAISACSRHTSRQTIIVDLWKIAELRSENQWYALRTLAQFGERRVIDVCAPVLRGGSSDIIHAANAVGFLANGESLALLKDLFEETIVEPLRFVLACGIVRSGGSSATPYLEEHVDAVEGLERIVCLCTLVGAGSSKGKSLLADLLERSSPVELDFARNALITHNVAAASSPNWVEATKQWLERG